MRCKNSYCKYNINKEECSLIDKVIIGNDGICTKYEKGLQYYLTLLPRTMTSNFLLYPDLTYELRCSIYYLMKCIPLSFAADELRGILYFKNKKTGKKMITKDDIWDMIDNDMDMEKLYDCIIEVENKGLPTKDDEDEEEKEIEYKEYGWLSPTGEYYEAEFGDHEAKAREIIKNRNWYSDYREWEKSSDELYLCGDYLSRVKGYALIHDPSGLRRYLVTHSKPLTKKQKDFLYGFFIDMNMKSRAEVYIDD